MIFYYQARTTGRTVTIEPVYEDTPTYTSIPEYFVSPAITATISPVPRIRHEEEPDYYQSHRATPKERAVWFQQLFPLPSLVYSKGDRLYNIETTGKPWKGLKKWKQKTTRSPPIMIRSFVMGLIFARGTIKQFYTV